MGTVTAIQDREVYGVSQAADLLGLRTDRVRAWLDGYERAGIRYDPVIREESTASDLVTWGEFVELGYLREYRKAGVSLQSLRPVIADLRDRYESPYPLAMKRPFVGDRELILELQQEHQLDQKLWIVARSGQLAACAESFLRKVEFDPNELATSMMPAGSQSPVRINPEVSFGMPAVDGIATERLFEIWQAEDQDTEWLASVYDLDVAKVRASIAFEEQRLSVAG